MIEFLDTVFRYGAIAFCGMMVALALRDARGQLAGRLSAALSFCTACFLLATAPDMATKAGALMVPLMAISMATPGVLWLFSLSMFSDDFVLTRSHWFVVGVYWVLSVAFLPGFWLTFDQLPAVSPAELRTTMIGAGHEFFLFNLVSSVLKFGMVLHMLHQSWHGRDDDLLEDRRKFRTAFVLAGATIMVGVFVLLNIEDELSRSAMLVAEAVQAGAIMLIVMFLFWHAARIDSDWLLGNIENRKPTLITDLSTPTDMVDLQRLNDLARGATLLEPGLTIAGLSEIAQMPEHRLRRLINQHLGYRNFSDFLNHHRVEAAKTRLADHDIRYTPILTIAMDLGYGSLGPFNRAFKERTGLTPTEFRRNVLRGG